jgi:hypothetical protein
MDWRTGGSISGLSGTFEEAVAGIGGAGYQMCTKLSKRQFAEVINKVFTFSFIGSVKLRAVVLPKKKTVF